MPAGFQQVAENIFVLPNLLLFDLLKDIKKCLLYTFSSCTLICPHHHTEILSESGNQLLQQPVCLLLVTFSQSVNQLGIVNSRHVIPDYKLTFTRSHTTLYGCNCPPFS